MARMSMCIRPHLRVAQRVTRPVTGSPDKQLAHSAVLANNGRGDKGGSACFQQPDNSDTVEPFVQIELFHVQIQGVRAFEQEVQEGIIVP